VFENRVPRKIFCSKREEMAGGWRELRSEEVHKLNNLNFTRVSKPRRMRWTEHVARLAEMINAYNSLVGETEG
jgi:hypothetical protein